MMIGAEMIYLELALRGAIVVGLISWQTLNLQRGGGLRIAIGAFLIGAFWYGNVLATVEAVPYGWVAYSAGSTLGALFGWQLDRWL